MVKSLHSTGSFAARLNLPADVRVPIEHAIARSAQPHPLVTDTAAAAPRRSNRRSSIRCLPRAWCRATSWPSRSTKRCRTPQTSPAARSRPRRPRALSRARSLWLPAMKSFAPVCGRRLGESIRVVVHDPEDQQDLAMVGLNEKNERLLVNRDIFEADIVLPIGCAG